MAKIVIIVGNLCPAAIREKWMEALMATMNVSLPDPMKVWVERQAEGGRYGNASDYVRDLIRKDQKRKAAIDALQAAITEGVQSGEPQAFDPTAFKLRVRERYVVR